MVLLRATPRDPSSRKRLLLPKKLTEFVQAEVVMRTKELRLRVSDEEYEQLKAKKTRAQMAVWIRETMLNVRDAQPVKQADPDLLYQLNKIGVNLNQIAKYCNEQRKTGQMNLVKILVKITEIERQMKELINSDSTNI